MLRMRLPGAVNYVRAACMAHMCVPAPRACTSVHNKVWEWDGHSNCLLLMAIHLAIYTFGPLRFSLKKLTFCADSAVLTL